MTTAIILAGGLGTRLRSAVPDLPKPMAHIQGKPFLVYLMDYWIRQGVSQFILSVGYQRKVIMDYFGENYRDIPITYVIEEEPLGTGGGLLLASMNLNEPFLVLNGDTFFEVDLTLLLQFHAEQKSDWTFSLFHTNEVGRYMGMDLAADGRIINFKSGTSQPSRLANGGVYLLNPLVLRKASFVSGSKLSLEDDMLPSLVEAGSVFYGLESTGRFIDIGIPDDYFRASDILSHYGV